MVKCTTDANLQLRSTPHKLPQTTNLAFYFTSFQSAFCLSLRTHLKWTTFTFFGQSTIFHVPLRYKLFSSWSIYCSHSFFSVDCSTLSLLGLSTQAPFMAIKAYLSGMVLSICRYMGACSSSPLLHHHHHQPLKFHFRAHFPLLRHDCSLFESSLILETLHINVNGRFARLVSLTDTFPIVAAKLETQFHLGSHALF